MVIVTGSVVGTADTIDELERVSLEHVHRSRTEAGCLAHAVHRDLEDPLRLVFVEQWADRDALRVHVRQPGSVAFLEAIGPLTAEPGTMDVYEVA